MKWNHKNAHAFSNYDPGSGGSKCTPSDTFHLNWVYSTWKTSKSGSRSWILAWPRWAKACPCVEVVWSLLMPLRWPSSGSHQKVSATCLGSVGIWVCVLCLSEGASHSPREEVGFQFVSLKKYICVRLSTSVCLCHFIYVHRKSSAGERHKKILIVIISGWDYERLFFRYFCII